jgi:hypothetical protein
MDNSLLLSAGGFALGLIAVVLVVISFLRQLKTEKRLRAFMAGKDGEDLEKVLVAHGEDMKKITANLDELLKASEYLHRALQNSLRKVAFERYNPFPGVGGNQSFTLVMLDAFNSGVVISSMHNRDSNRVYAKSVKNGSPLQNLSEEEQRVLKNAIMMKGA